MLDKKTQLRAAHNAMAKARDAYEDWYRDVVANRRPYSRVEGLKLAEDLDRRMREYLAFKEAG